MSFDQIDPEPILYDDDHNSTFGTANYTPIASTEDGHDRFGRSNPTGGPFLVPWPGSIYIIRSVSSGHVITLLDGQIVLTQPSQDINLGSIYWACVDVKGWLAFRNFGSGRHLGHDKNGRLCCVKEQPKGWEYFCVRMKPEGGCVLLMQHWEKLWHVGMVEAEQGVNKLAKIEDGGSRAMVWEFIEI